MALSTYAITRLSGLQFTVVSDLTGYFEEYRPILLVGDTQQRLYVHSSSFDSVLTTVTVSGGNIIASASGVAIGDLSITNSAIPYEYLDTLYINTSEMTTISGDLVSYIDTISGGLQTQIDAIDTSNYYTKAEITTISGDILSYVSTTYVDNSEMTTISGDIINQIPTDYYTTGQVDSISGALHSEIENIDLTTLSGDLVIGYTQADTTLSGLLHAEIVAASGTTDHSLLTSLDYASSGHTGFQPTGDYVTESEFTTYSGDIINQIPTDFYTTSQVDAISGALHIEIENIDLNYISNAEMTTISGDLVSGYTAADTATYLAANLYTDTVLSGVSSTLTSHTSDSTIHFTVASIDHGSIAGLADDDHTQYHNDTRGDLRYFTQSQITTQSGDIVAQIVTDHGGLTGLTDDDHTQYILVNGSRGFTSTISGVVPSADEHLATKGYVDSTFGEGVSVSAGTQTLSSGSTTVTIDFGLEFPDTGYGIACEMQNLTDPNPSIYDMTITSVTTSGFSLEFSGVIDSDNYYLRYTAISSGTVSATDHGSLSGLLDDDHTQYYNEARGDARYYTESEVDTISGVINAAKANVVHTHVEADITDLQSYLVNVVEDTTPQLGGDLDLNGKCLNYGTILSSNGTYVGDYMTVTVDDASSVSGSVLYQGTDFHFDRADADATTTSPVFVMALESGAGSKKVLIRGQICLTAWNWSAGKLYLSTDIGTMTQTKPSGSGDVIQVLGFALSADTIWFDPVTMVAEVA